MKILRTISELRAELAERRAAGASVGFVPTMGSFHEGHTSLMRAAREQCDTVVVSLFVNPTQLADPVAFDTYPRNEWQDAHMARAEGVDVLFAPSTEEIYPDGFATTVAVEGELVDTLLATGLAKDGQLTGMCTIIVKLLNIVQPTRVFFGEKDLPHWIAVERMAQDLNLPSEVAVLPTVREADGLAMSSRNVRLGEHRKRAACVPRAVRAAVTAIAGGETDPRVARERALAELAGDGVEVDYVEILDVRTLRAVTDLRLPAVVAVGVRIGGVPLLDITRTVPAAAGAPLPAPPGAAAAAPATAPAEPTAERRTADPVA